MSLTDLVRNEKVLQRVKEERNIIHTIKRRKANWIGHILCRSYHLKHIIEGNIGVIEVTGRNEEDVSTYLMTLRKQENNAN
jgi:hypothetical protein